jgi:hypothetical protein
MSIVASAISAIISETSCPALVIKAIAAARNIPTNAPPPLCDTLDTLATTIITEIKYPIIRPLAKVI